MDVFRFNLGDVLKDRLTGLTGVAVNRSEHLFGCARYWLQPREIKDGKTVDGQWFDEDSLELVEAGVVQRKHYRVYEADTAPLRRTGGPATEPASHSRGSSR